MFLLFLPFPGYLWPSPAKNDVILFQRESAGLGAKVGGTEPFILKPSSSLVYYHFLHTMVL